MQFEEDEALLTRYYAGDDSVFDMLILKYRPLMIKYTQKFFIPLMDFEDMLQECRIVMFKAVQSYRLGSEARFVTFYRLLLNNHFCELLRRSNAYKRIGDNVHRSDPFVDTSELVNYSGVLYAQSMDPADVVEVREGFYQAYDTLSQHEQATFYQVQADHKLLHNDKVKQVIYRSQHKLRKALKQRLE